MTGTLLLICVAMFEMAPAEIEKEPLILKRLETAENLIQDLLQEVNNLKSNDKLQKDKINSMEKQLHSCLNQDQRNKQLDKLYRRLRVCERQRTPVNIGIHSDTVQQSQLGQTKDKIPVNRNRIRRLENEQLVAFFAKMTNHLEHAGIHQPFIFDTVVTNVGNAYNNHLGTFVAPVSGTYVFSTTLVSFHHVSAHAQFVKNGNPVTTLFVSGAEAGYDTTSQSIILQLKQGDDVTVQNLESDKSFYGRSQSTFSGFLLQEDYSSPAVVGK